MLFKRQILPLITLIAISFSLLALSGCTQNTQAKRTHPQSIRVVSSLDFYGEAAKAVLGDKGTVTSIIDKPSMEPHEFEATTQTAKTVSDADVVIYNGLGYDSWMTRLTQDTQAATVNVSESVMHKSDGDNEHVWYDMKTMPKLARYLVKKFSTLQPQNKAYFAANAKRYINSLAPLQRKVAQLKANSNGARVNVSEPVFDYALTEMGYHQNNNHYAQAVQNDTDPSPKDIKQMQADITNHKIAFFVVNSQEISKMTTNLLQLAYKSHVPVVKVTESQPAHITYEQWMMRQFNQVQAVQRAAD
ncbi:metal ABC transporter solute-binding protein, Zn/Mn family [Secundilactobacillus muriivasis]